MRFPLRNNTAILNNSLFSRKNFHHEICNTIEQKRTPGMVSGKQSIAYCGDIRLLLYYREFNRNMARCEILQFYGFSLVYWLSCRMSQTPYGNRLSFVISLLFFPDNLFNFILHVAFISRCNTKHYDKKSCVRAFFSIFYAFNNTVL